MAWQPDLEPLRELVGYLKNALSAHDQKAQKYATMVCTKNLYLTLEYCVQRLF